CYTSVKWLAHSRALQTPRAKTAVINMTATRHQSPAVHLSSPLPPYLRVSQPPLSACIFSSPLQADIRSSEQCLDVIDEVLTTMDGRVCMLEDTCKELMAATVNLRDKLGHMEARSRWANIRIPADFVSSLLLDVLGKDNFIKPIKVERAHRTLRPKPAAGQRPRAIIAKLHHEKDMWHVLRLARQRAPLSCDGERLSIFPDYTVEVLAQRMAFNTVRKKLCASGATCSLRYPTQLRVVHNNITNTFKSPAEAERFKNVRAPPPPNPPCTNTSSKHTHTPIFCLQTPLRFISHLKHLVNN
uniref:Uncharacterized protein n=1 Tax=Oreochromis aureus TaxID=47969 RepID=A0AAZ1Y5A5_OREAU